MKNKLLISLTGSTEIRSDNILQQTLRFLHIPEKDQILSEINKLIASMAYPKKEIKDKECVYKIKKREIKTPLL